MKTTSLLFLVAFCVVPTTAHTDPWSWFFRETLDSLLKEASENWQDEVNITNVTVSLVKHDDGWLSLRQGELHNLSSWYLIENVTLNCSVASTGILRADLRFDDLQFSFSYLYDNGTTLDSSRELSGILKGLTAQFFFIDKRYPTYYYSNTAFHLEKQEISVELTDVNAEHINICKAEMTRAVKRALGNNILAGVEQRIANILFHSITIWDIYAVPPYCTPATTTAAPTTSKTSVASVTTTNTTTKQTDVTTKPHNIASTHASTTKHNTPATENRTAKTTKLTKSTTKKPASSTTTKHAAIITESLTEQNREQITWNVKDNGLEEQNIKSSAVSLTEDQITELNNRTKDILARAKQLFAPQNLLPYRMPNTEDELYEKTEGTATVNVTLKGLRKVTVSGEPYIERMNNTVRVTATVQFNGITYSAELGVKSINSDWVIEGEVEQLTGQLIVMVNYDNVSAANVTLEKFELKPFVLLTGSPKPVRMARKHIDASELEDAVKGTFKMVVIHMLSEDDTALLNAAFLNETIDVSYLFPTTTASTPSTTLKPPRTSASSVPSTSSTTSASSTTSTTSASSATSTTSASSTTSTTSASATSTTPESSTLLTTPASVYSTTPSSACLSCFFQGQIVFTMSILYLILSIRMCL